MTNLKYARLKGKLLSPNTNINPFVSNEPQDPLKPSNQLSADSKEETKDPFSYCYDYKSNCAGSEGSLMRGSGLSDVPCVKLVQEESGEGDK